MRDRDRRALIFLGGWCLCVGLFLGGRWLISGRQQWNQSRSQLRQLQIRKAKLFQERQALDVKQSTFLGAFPQEWKSMPSDQLRLKGQGGLLESAGKGGLRNVRLRSESLEQALTGRQFVWTLEGEGTLMQWVSALQAIERSQPFMSILGFRLEVPGDPWHQENVGEEGPVLKGAARCSWVVGP